MIERLIYIFLFVISLILCLLLALYSERQEYKVLKIIVAANNLFCIEYIAFSCIFIFFDTFAVWKPLLCVIIVNSTVLTIFRVKKRKYSKLRFLVEKYEWVSLGLTFFVLLLIHTTAEDIGTSSDQGAYFTHTIVYMEEKSQDIHKLKESGKFSENVEIGLYELQNKLGAFNHEEGDTYYTLHSSGTWCSITALYGKMFGNWNCMKALNYIYVLIVWNMIFLCKKMECSCYGIHLMWGVFALSPLNLYIGKAGLSEIATLLLYVMGARCILENRKQYYFFSGICIGLVGFVHGSAILYLPIISIMAFCESINKEKKLIAIFNIVQILCFGCSIWYIYRISPIYTKYQYRRLPLMDSVGVVSFFIAIDIMIVAAAGFQFLIYKRKIPAFIVRIKEYMYRYWRTISAIVIIIILAKTLYNTYFICFTDEWTVPKGSNSSWELRNTYINKGLSSISYLNIVNIARATGVIGLVIFMCYPFFRKRLRENIIPFYYMGLYGLAIYTILKVDTPFNYYASRYFVPFLVPLISIILVSSLDKKWLIWQILLISFMFNLRYWFAFPEGGPYVGQYKMAQDALEAIPPRAVVYCNPQSDVIANRLVALLRIMNDNEVFNMNNYDEISVMCSDSNSYVISGTPIDNMGKLVLSNTYKSQYSFGNGPNGSYSMLVGTYDIPLYIYQISK